MGIALRFRRLIVAFRGGRSGAPPRLRSAEFIKHSINPCLALLAVITDDTHGGTLPRQLPAGLS